MNHLHQLHLNLLTYNCYFATVCAQVGSTEWPASWQCADPEYPVSYVHHSQHTTPTIVFTPPAGTTAMVMQVHPSRADKTFKIIGTAVDGTIIQPSSSKVIGGLKTVGFYAKDWAIANMTVSCDAMDGCKGFAFGRAWISNDVVGANYPEA